MADTKKINVIIDGNAKGLKQATATASTSMNKMTATANKMGGALAAAFSVTLVLNFVKATVKAFDVQAKAEAKLLTALKGRADIQKRLLQQARNLQQITLFGDEDTINAQAFLAAMGLSEDAIMRLTPLVQDLATKMGGDLRSAADMIAKSVGSSTNALSRYGITIEGAVGSAERLESAITGLNAQVGGQSEAAAKAGAGAFIQLDNAIGDLMETIGKLIAGESGDFVRWLIGVVEATDKLIASTDFLLLAVNPLLGLFNAYGESVVQAKDAIEKTAAAQAFMATTANLTNEELKVMISQMTLAGGQMVILGLLQDLLTGRLADEAEALRLVEIERQKRIEQLKEEEALRIKGLADTFTQNIQNTQAAEGMAKLSAAADVQIKAQTELNRQNWMALQTGKKQYVLTKQLIEVENVKTDATRAGEAAMYGSASAMLSLAIQGKATAKDVIASLLAMTIAMAIEKSFESSKNPFIGAALAVVASGLVLGLFASLPAFATGTSFAPGGAALVGERGPEVVNLPRGATVTPNHQLGGGGVDVYVNGFVGNPTELASEISILLSNEAGNVSRSTFL